MKVLAYALLWSLAAVLPPGAVAQTAAEREKALVVAPQAPAAAPQAGAAEPQRPSAGPANICRELVAYLEKKAAAPQSPAAAVQPGPNPATSAAGASVQGSGQPAPVPQTPAAGAPGADDLPKAS